MINHQQNIDKIYLYAKDPDEAKNKLLIYKREIAGLNYLNDSKHSVNIYEGNNPNKKQKILILFHDMIADMLSNKKLIPLITELLIRGRNISLLFITQPYFVIPKNFRLNWTHYFLMKVPNKRELQQIAFNNSSDIDFQYFMNLYKKCTANNILF